MCRLEQEQRKQKEFEQKLEKQRRQEQELEEQRRKVLQQREVSYTTVGVFSVLCETAVIPLLAYVLYVIALTANIL